MKWFALFLSSGTLICCALPILFASLGFGSVVAAVFYNVPGLLFLTEHKVWTLIAWFMYREKQMKQILKHHRL